MKISGIDKDFENIIYNLNENGFKPFASCDGVLANHSDPQKVHLAYISFMKSPKIINLMSDFINKHDDFFVVVKSGNYTPYEIYGNIIEGPTYSVYFNNKLGDKTNYFENIINNSISEKNTKIDAEENKLKLLEKVLEGTSNSNLIFQVAFNYNIQQHDPKIGKLHRLYVISNYLGNNKHKYIQNDLSILPSILSKKYNSPCLSIDDENYPYSNFILQSKNKGVYSMFFTDENYNQLLDCINSIVQIEPTLPTFTTPKYNTNNSAQTPLQLRKKILNNLKGKLDILLKKEQTLKKDSEKNNTSR